MGTNFARREEKAERVVSIAAFVIMVLMISINVFSRYILSKSFAFAEEIAYLGFNWSVFIGVCRMYRSKGLVAVDVFVDKLPAQVQKYVDLLINFVLTATNIAVAYYSIALAITGWSRRTAYLEIPYTFMYMPAAIAFVIMSITSIAFLFRPESEKKK